VIWIGDGDPRALFKISPSQQVEIYKHISDAKEARRVFEVVGTDKGIGDWDRRRRIQTAAIALREWAESGFAEDWDEVSPRFDAN